MLGFRCLQSYMLPCPLHGLDMLLVRERSIPPYTCTYYRQKGEVEQFFLTRIPSLWSNSTLVSMLAGNTLVMKLTSLQSWYYMKYWAFSWPVPTDKQILLGRVITRWEHLLQMGDDRPDPLKTITWADRGVVDHMQVSQQCSKSCPREAPWESSNGEKVISTPIVCDAWEYVNSHEQNSA